MNNNCEELKNLIRYSKKELIFKIVVIGDFGVGKTSIIKRYAEGTYSTTYKITIGADFAIKRFEWDDYTSVILQLWDIAGHERFGTLTSVYYRYAVAAIIVFDLTRPETFKSVEKWLTDLRKKDVMQNGIPVILLANKGDINISNLPPKITDFCRIHNILSWFITSAKDNLNIDEAMFVLMKNIIENYKNQQYISDRPIVLTKNPKEKPPTYHCCVR